MERLSNAGKLEKARRLADRGRYEEAMELVRELDLTKIKVLADLSGVADIYEANGYTEEALQLMKRVYEKSRTRRVLYQLTVFSVKLNEVDEAERYYQEFLAIAPADADQYVLRFLIDRLKRKSVSMQIQSLEKLKEYEYREEWAYELAKLYYKAGLKEKCIRECQDIEIWFGDGPTVDKAIQLRESLGGKKEVFHQKKESYEESEPPELLSEQNFQMETIRPHRNTVPTERTPVQNVSILENVKRRTAQHSQQAEQIRQEQTRQEHFASWIEERRAKENTAETVKAVTPVKPEKIVQTKPEIKRNEVEEAPKQEILQNKIKEVPWKPEEDVPEPAAEPMATEEIPTIESAYYDMKDPVPEPVWKTEPLLIPEDSLVRLAVSSLEEDDYILTAEQVGWLKELADELRTRYGKGTALTGEMQRLVEQIIDRAERRNMKRLLDIVNKSNYRESGLLSLEREDFLVL